MQGSIVFFDVFGPHYLSVVAALARDGFLPILNGGPLITAASAAGIPHCTWNAFRPAELGPHVQREVERIMQGVAGALELSDVRRAFSASRGDFLPVTGPAFFAQLEAMLAGQVAALDVFDAVVRQHDVRLLVLGCDNSHIQRVLVEDARRRGIRSLQLAHGIYAPIRARVAGEMHAIYADYVAAFGERARRVLVALGNATERIMLTGAPSWDGLYAPAAQVSQGEARRRLGLDPDRAAVLFCASYVDGSSGFFPATLRELAAIYRGVVSACRQLEGPVQLLVRPHPHEFGRANVSDDEREHLLKRHRGWLADCGIRDVHVLCEHKIECIRAADVVVVEGASTIIPEVMILDRPVVMVPLAQQAPPVYTGDDGIIVVHGAEELPGVLANLLDAPERRAQVVRAQRAVLPELNYGDDGRAAERVAEAVGALAASAAVESARPPGRRAAAPWRSRLEVLFAVHDFLPGSRAGTELYTHDLARALERRGHGVRVLYPRVVSNDTPCSIHEGEYQGLPITELVYGASMAGALYNDAIRGVLRQYLQQRRPDVVHVQHLMGLSVSCFEVLRELDLPIVFTANDFWFLCEQLHLVHANGARCGGPETVDGCVQCLCGRMGGIDEEQLPQLFHYLADRHYRHRRALEIADLVICPSRFLRDTFQRYGFRGRRIVHSAQGASLFTPLGRSRAADHRVVFSYLGTIGYRKGLDLLVAAFNQVDTSKAELHVHGAIADREYFTETMRGTAPGKSVVYHGAYGPADLPAILAATDVVVVPSRGENFPFVIREALHGSVPVIAPAVGGIPEIVQDGVNGLLFRSNDALDLATKLAAVMDDPQRVEAWRHRIGPVKSIDEDAEEIEAHYGTILAERHSRRATDVQVSVVVTVSDGAERTEQCLNALAGVTSGVAYEVIIVDDGSTDETAHWLAMLRGDVTVIRNDAPRGHVACRNQGARAGRGRYLVFLDADTRPQAGWLAALAEDADGHPEIGVIGSKVLNVDGTTVYHAGIAFSRDEQFPYHVYPGCPASFPQVNRRREFQAVAGAGLLVRRELFSKIGGFDEAYGSTALAAVDFCLRVRETGHRVVYEPRSVLQRIDDLLHGDGADGDGALFCRRWQHTELGDEDLVLMVDGCVRRLRSDGGRQVSVIEPVGTGAERDRWARVVDVQRLARDGNLAGAVPLLLQSDGWPQDESALRWMARMCDRVGIPGGPGGAATRATPQSDP